MSAKFVGVLILSHSLSAHANFDCANLFAPSTVLTTARIQTDNLRARLIEARDTAAYNFYYGADNRPLLELVNSPKYVNDFLTRRYYWIRDVNTESLVPLKADFENYDTNVFSADGKEVSILENDGSPGESRPKHRIFSTETGEFLREIPPVRNRYGLTVATDYKLSTDFKTAIVKTNAGQLSVLDVSGQQPRVLVKLEGEDASLSPDGNFVVLKNPEGQIIYRLENGELTKVLKAKRSRGRYNEIFSGDGRYVFIKDELTTAGIFSLTTGKEVSRFPLLFEHAVNITPDGDAVLLIRGNTVVIRDVLSGEERAEFVLKDNYSKGAPIGPNFLRGLFFTPDAKKVGLYLSSPGEGKNSELFMIDIQNEIIETVR